MIIFFFLLSYLPAVVSNSNGAPCGAYDTMTPQHTGVTVTDAAETPGAPYKVRVLDEDSKDLVHSYHEGGIYVVEITATKPLKGMLLQARRVPLGMQVGEFVESVDFDRYCLKHQRCGFRVVRETVTHTGANCPTRVNCSTDNPCVIKMPWKVIDTPRNAVRIAFTGVVEYKTAFIHVFSQTLEPDRAHVSVGDASEDSVGGNEARRIFACANLQDNAGWQFWCSNYCSASCCRDPYQKQQCDRTCCLKNIF